MVTWREPWVWEIRDLKGPKRSIQLLETARDHVDRDLVLDLTHVREVYPNGAIPFASVLSHLRANSQQKISLHLPDDDARLHHLDVPLTIDTFERVGGHTLTHSVWRYNNESEAQRITNLFMEALTDQVHCEEGVIDSITWCLYEVMDNVFQHSQAEAGFVMMQLHHARRQCTIAVADNGIGIQKSLATTRAAPLEVLLDPARAIGHSLQQGVTSKSGQNQGNGLYGLRRAVEINGGQLNIHSGWGNWSLRGARVNSFTDRHRPLIDQEKHQGTLVDWQLDCSTKVRIDEALGRTAFTSDFLEAIEDEQGVHRVDVSEIEEALGSRKLGAEIRTRLDNYLNAGAQHVVLDFKGVGVVSSSFADEVLAKLAFSMGELEFRRRVFVDNASVTNRGLIERAIAMRLEAAGVDGPDA